MGDWWLYFPQITPPGLSNSPRNKQERDEWEAAPDVLLSEAWLPLSSFSAALSQQQLSFSCTIENTNDYPISIPIQGFCSPPSASLPPMRVSPHFPSHFSHFASPSSARWKAHLMKRMKGCGELKQSSDRISWPFSVSSVCPCRLGREEANGGEVKGDLQQKAEYSLSPPYKIRTCELNSHSLKLIPARTHGQRHTETLVLYWSTLPCETASK